MKFIRNIFIFFGVIIVLLGALLALTFDSTGSEMLPTHLYTDEYDSSEMIFKELNSSFEDVESETTSDLEVDLDDDIINRFIYEKIVDGNEYYAPGENCSTDDECYVVAANAESEQGSINTHVVGVYAIFFDGSNDEDPGRLVLNIYLEVDLNGFFTYKTVVEAHFLFKDDTYNNEYFLEFDKLQVGNIRMPKSFFTWIIKQTEKSGAFDIESLIEDLPIGSLDLEDLSYTIDKDEILTHLGETSEENSYNQLTQEMLSISFDRDLVVLDLQDNKFALEVQVSQFSNTDIDKTDIPLYLYALHDSEVVAGTTVYGSYNDDLFDSTTYLQNIFTEFILNEALTLTDDDTSFYVSEKRFNKLIYSNASGFVDARKVETITLSETETKEIELGLKAIWFEFVESDDENPSSVYAKALFEISGIESLLVIKADVEYVDVVYEGQTYTEMHCVFNELTFGKDDDETSGQYIELTEMSAFKEVFALIGDFEFGEFNEEGDLVISPLKLTSLLSNGTEEDAIRVTGVQLVENGLTLDIDAPNHQATLDSFNQAMNDGFASPELLDAVFDALEPTADSNEEEVYDTIVDIQASLAGGDTASPEQITELLNGFEGLSTESQSDFLEAFETVLTSSGNESELTDFENIFGPLSD